MTTSLRVIVIEDNPDDAVLVVREVEHAGYTVEALRVQTAEELRDALAQGTWDLVLSDYSMPHFSAAEGLSILWETGLDTPLIIVSGKIGEETAVKLMKDGATDYVMKDHLSRLGPVVQRELREADERREKRDAERALAESEKRYRHLVESQSDLIVKTDPEGRLLYANSTYCTLFGKSLEEMTGLGYQPLVHPDDLPSVERTVADLFHPPHLCRYEERAMTVNGWRWIEWTANAELDGKGTVVALVGSGRDITDRKKVEEALHESDDLYQSLVRVSPMSICRKDLEGRFTFANQRFLEELNPSLADLIGKTDFYLHPPELAEKYRRDDRTVMDSGQAREFIEERAVLGGGSTIIQSYKTPIYDEARKVSGVQISFWDITERTKLEQEVAHLASFQTLSPFGIIEIGCDGSVRFANAAALATLVRLGLDPNARQFLPGTPEELILLRLQCERNPQTQELHLGEASFQRVVAAPPGGDSLRVYVTDITDRKRAEKEKEGLQAQLQQSQKMDAMGQLAGGVAHDFNNLLTGILGNVAIMRSDLKESHPLVANLDAVESAAHQAANLAKGLLAFGRKALVTAVPLDMVETIDTTLAMLKESLPATMKIVRGVEGPAWSVLADSSQMTQLILNLALNARDAMKGSGTLTVRLRNEQVGEEYVRTHSFARTGEFVHLSVADTGPGIPDEVREHLFEPFFTTKPSGTGLGLAIVYGAVKQADGWVTTDSPPGRGAVFDIFLPRCREEPSKRGVPDGTAHVGSGTVLVVEDEPVVCAVAEALLSRSGYDVLTASDGASALCTLPEHRDALALILLDMTMPGMSTEEIVQKVRAVDARVPILLTSGYASGDLVKQMLDEGSVQGFLAKPYDAPQLTDSVWKVLHRE